MDLIGKQKRQIAVVLLIAAGWLSLTFAQAQSRAPGAMEVVFLDVGYGDSALLRDGNGFDVLIDGGQYIHGPKIASYLRVQGVADIDVMVASHAHDDHVAGLIAVLEMDDIPVRSVLYNGYPGDSTMWQNFVAAVKSEGLSLKVIRYPDTLQWGEMTVHVLNPTAGLSDPVDLNASSLVLRVDQGDFGVLFTGDIGAEVEAEVLARGTPAAADVLKVAYHGSSSSSSPAFLQAVSPADSVISVNGDPDPVTVDRLKAAGARVWWTSRDGDVRFTASPYDPTQPPASVDMPYHLNLPLLIR